MNALNGIWCRGTESNCRHQPFQDMGALSKKLKVLVIFSFGKCGQLNGQRAMVNLSVNDVIFCGKSLVVRGLRYSELVQKVCAEVGAVLREKPDSAYTYAACSLNTAKRLVLRVKRDSYDLSDSYEPWVVRRSLGCIPHPINTRIPTI